MPSLTPPRAEELRDELARYLSTDPEQVLDVLLWWTERKATYPNLSRMALDYLSIPGMYSFTSRLIFALMPALGQQLQQMWSESLAKVDSSYRTYATAYRHNLFEPLCVLEAGVC